MDKQKQKKPLAGKRQVVYRCDEHRSQGPKTSYQRKGEATMNLWQEMNGDEWSSLDAVWNCGGVNYWDFVRLFGIARAKEVTKKMPNMLKKTGGKHLDEAAQEYGFESDEALGQAMMDFVPKKEKRRLVEKQMRMYWADIEEQEQHALESEVAI
jgi:hypothetical protein